MQQVKGFYYQTKYSVQLFDSKELVIDLFHCKMPEDTTVEA